MLRLLGILLAPVLCAGAVRTLTFLPKAYVTATAMDRAGAIYVAGYIESPDLTATPGAFQSQYHATTCQGPQFPFPCPDAFVVKMDAAGKLMYATYLGGDQYDVATAITVDASGNAYVAGYTTSTNFPLTANHLPYDSIADGFAVKLSPSGSALVYSTRLPGFSGASAIAIDGSGQAHIAGSARGPGLPVTPGAVESEFPSDPGYASGVVLKLNSRGDQVLFATYLGGSREDNISGLALDLQGNVYVAGSTTSTDFPFTAGSVDTRPSAKQGFADAFVAKLNAAGTQLMYSARPSGSCNDRPASIAVDGSGRAFITGWTCSIDYPTIDATLQSEISLMPSITFITVLSADGSSLDYSTYFGGSQSSAGTSIALDSQSRIVVNGWTQDSDFPTSAGAPQRCNNAPDLYQGFLVRLDPTSPAARFATYLDVHGTAIPGASTGDGVIFAAGSGPDGSRIVAVDPARSTGLGLQCVASSANGWSVTFAPGELVTLYGTGLGPAQIVVGAPDSSGVFGTELAGTRILFDGVPAPVLAVSDDELRAVVPFGLTGRSTVRVQVQRGANQSEPLDLTMAGVVPGLFRIGATNQVAVLNQDGTVNSPANPAERGSVITFWATGLGTMDPPVGDGAVASSDSLSKIVAPIRVGFFGWPAEVLYSGSAPGLVAGVVQINVRVPDQMGPFAYPVDLIIQTDAAYIPVRMTVNIK